MSLTSDDDLRDEGLLPLGRGKVLFLACGAVGREVLAIIAANGWRHIDLQCLPAILHNTPEQIVPRVEQAVAAAGGRYERIFVVYADCGTGGLLEQACARLGVEMVAGPHCYSFFEGNQTFAVHGEGTAFWLTDFLVRQFDAFVWRPLGLDRHPQLRFAYFGNYKRLIYLAQTDDPALDVLARGHAARLGLAYERRLTGYGDLPAALARVAG